MSGVRGLEPLQRPRLYEQVVARILEWVRADGLGPGDRLPPERELAVRLGVSRATVAQALVAMEVVGAVSVRHGDGVVLADAPGTSAVVEALRRHAQRLPEVIEAREALETKLAALAAQRRTEADLARIEAALEAMAADIEVGGHGVAGDEEFHAAVTAAGHSSLLARLMAEISDLIAETRVESLGQPGRPQESLAGHRRIVDAIRRRDPAAAAAAMSDHIDQVSDVALLRDGDASGDGRGRGTRTGSGDGAGDGTGTRTGTGGRNDGDGIGDDTDASTGTMRASRNSARAAAGGHGRSGSSRARNRAQNGRS